MKWFMLKRFMQEGQDGQGGGQGGGTSEGYTPTGWLAGLPEDLRGEASLSTFTGGEKGEELIPMPKGVAKAFIETKRLVGRDKLPIPNTPEEFSLTMERLGKPKTKDGYTVKLPADVPPVAKPIIEADLNWFREVAHEADITDAQAAKLWTKYMGKVLQGSKDLQDTIQNETRQAEQALRAEHGTAYDGLVALADRAVEQLGGAELKTFVEQAGLKRSAHGLRFLVNIGKLMAEDLGIDPNTGQPSGAAQTLESQLQEAMSDKAFTNKSDPRHKTVIDTVMRLRTQLVAHQKAMQAR